MEQPDIINLNIQELKKLQEKIELRISLLLSNSQPPESFALLSAGHKYVGGAYCAIVDANKKVIRWLEPVETEYCGSYTTEIYIISADLIGEELMWGDTSSGKGYRKYGKVVLNEETNKIEVE